MARHLSIIVILAVAAFLSLSFLMSFGDKHDQVPQTFTAPGGSYSSESKSSEYGAPLPAKPAQAVQDESSQQSKLAGLAITDDILKGGAIAPKLENATIKYVPQIACRIAANVMRHCIITSRERAEIPVPYLQDTKY